MRPPAANQFKPGQSGNPKGRPKGSKSAQDIVRSILRIPVDAHEAGRRRKVALLEGVLLGVAQDALKRDIKAATLLIKLGLSLDRPEVGQNDPKLSADDQQLIASYFERELSKQKKGNGS